MTQRNRASRAAVAYAALAFLHLTRILPLTVCRALAAGFSHVGFWCVPRLRRVGFANLDRAYGDALTRQEKRRILIGAIRNAATVAAEFSHLSKLSGALLRDQVEVRGRDHVSGGRGFLIIGAHLGNWEWLATALQLHGVPLGGIVRPLDHPALNRAVDYYRRYHGVETVAKDAAGGRIFQLLRAGTNVGILVDQSPRENGVPVTFFGSECWATVAPAMVALRSKAPIVCGSMTRKPNGRYLLEIHPPLEIVRTGDLRQDLIRITQQCQDCIERMVREHPEQWLWFHRRWKPRPRLQAEWAARQQRAAKHEVTSDV